VTSPVVLLCVCLFTAVYATGPAPSDGLAELRRPALSELADSTSDTLVVHIVPHSHCDPGWLNTFEGYFLNEVSAILDSVVHALWKHPHRSFVWAESSFFSLWWERSSNQTRQRMGELVERG
jgi:hypothetical protein